MQHQIGQTSEREHYAIRLPESYLVLPDALPEATVFGPHFVGVGVAKCGTTRWYDLINAHPKACANRLNCKETNYFSYFGFESPTSAEIERYRALFARSPGFISGEWSPSYFLQPFAINLLAEAASDALFLVILRNPITRTLSHISQLERGRMNILGIRESDRPFFRMTTIIPETTAASLYSRTLKQLFGLIDPKRVLVLQFEQCVRNPRAMLAKTYRFLGLDDRFVPEGLLPAVVNGSPTPAGRLAQDARQRLVGYFSEDVRELASLVDGFDFDLWPDFNECLKRSYGHVDAFGHVLPAADAVGRCASCATPATTQISTPAR
ncbi:MAG TPA: sulfotransferase [Hyphomicrobium sp.]|nr:sulfotransferase [Hyphomicrobium sp.]